MYQLSKRHLSVCLGLVLGIYLIYSLYDGSGKHTNKDVHPKDTITCMPDDFIDTAFIKQVRKNETVTIPEVRTLEALSREELSALYHRYIENLQYMCKRKIRLGQIDDGGWDICDEERFRPTEGSCIVYSFGINNDFSFDEAVSKYYGCEVHSFDPSMDMADFTKGKIHFHKIGISARDEVTDDKWNLLRYSSIRSKLGHIKKDISILKIDIEIYEWEVLPDIISTGDLTGTSNLVVEFHLAMSSPEQEKDKYLSALKLLKSLYDNGYRIFWTHQNKWCQFLSKCKQELRTNCHEVNFVKKDISILKIDIEIYEWEVLPDIISTGDLTGTSNLVVEFHLAMSSPEQEKDKYLSALKLLKSLYDNGYRIFWTHQNKWCQFLSKCKQELRTNCHEVNFVKVR